ncbi:hypothetical protein JTB14_024552 [Gonioctena quinquepunctata]|nr:hypothetical protein JTB14_024552 [Gonioctena quinquepunctata]
MNDFGMDNFDDFGLQGKWITSATEKIDYSGYHEDVLHQLPITLATKKIYYTGYQKDVLLWLPRIWITLATKKMYNYGYQEYG